MKNKKYAITRKTNRAECGAVCQNDRLSAGHIWQTRSHVYGEVKCQTEIRSDVVIPNEFGNYETCKGLLRRFVHKITNNDEISPHNDMKDKILKRVQDDETNKNIKTLVPECPSALKPSVINLSTYRPIDSKKAAFTLAETLITLGIIGIVAAMTIPTLISNHQKKVTVTKIEKAISYLNQAYKLSYDDVGEPTLEESFEMNSKDYFNKYWAPYLKILQYCNTYSACNYKSNTPYKTINNKDISTMIIHPNGATFLTFDGYMFNIRSNYGNQLSRLIILDINGSQGPNKFGKDVFFLSRVEEDGGGIRCYCYEKTDADISKECSNKGEGYCCAEKIRRAGWKIENSYPWK